MQQKQKSTGNSRNVRIDMEGKKFKFISNINSSSIQVVLVTDTARIVTFASDYPLVPVVLCNAKTARLLARARFG